MGLSKRRELSVRVDAIDSLILFADTVRTEILCRRSALSSIIEEFKGVNQFFTALAESDIFPIISRYEKMRGLLGASLYLDQDCLKTVDSMFRVLGKTDEAEQCGMLEAVLTDLKEKKKKAYSDLVCLGSVYVKAGLAIGAFAVIICV